MVDRLIKKKHKKKLEEDLDIKVEEAPEEAPPPPPETAQQIQQRPLESDREVLEFYKKTDEFKKRVKKEAD